MYNENNVLVDTQPKERIYFDNDNEESTLSNFLKLELKNFMNRELFKLYVMKEK